MSKVVIIGAGGVGNVVTQKCASHPEVFEEILLASRTLTKCEKIAKQVKENYNKDIHIQQIDAENVPALVSLLKDFKPTIVINVALPYQDLCIMDACLEAGVHYLDTANYEPKDNPKFEYKYQWAYQEKYAQAGLMAILGCGFDPGVTNAFCAYAQKHLFDEITQIDILDCNAGDHGHPFATNFNPEINIREITQTVRHWQNGKWVETPPVIEENCIHFTFNYPEVGPRESYLLYHEEMESLVKHIKGLKKIRFWMTFSDTYLTHLRVLKNVGLTRIDEVEFEGCKIVPLKFLKALLPDPASLGTNYKGKTVIGCIFQGFKDGQKIKKYIYNICDHAKAYQEVKAQAVSYTTGVPAMAGAMMVLKEIWKGKGVFNIEELDPDPFLKTIAENGLPWEVQDFSGSLPE
ncbi:carboxynorspermidine dehydrogenase [Desulfonauticus submarinus]|uniref:Carboxynorspermidine dehydrogenase n=1 Tax=Desulfonauticus submarinus TaxID=206665 RepID=A0A1H0FWT3_9BACT|nr:saccharopine dehydrogenase family protein [Desulfonauticus submarinus]SDN99137.1 carboxynorspermidine dehydrogenase [Desulfonauticus submarinus]